MGGYLQEHLHLIQVNIALTMRKKLGRFPKKLHDFPMKDPKDFSGKPVPFLRDTNSCLKTQQNKDLSLLSPEASPVFLSILTHLPMDPSHVEQIHVFSTSASESTLGPLCHEDVFSGLE